MAEIKIMEKTNEEKDWSVRQGELEGKPVFVSFRANIDTKENRNFLPFQVGVAIPLLNPTVDGLPTNEEAKELWNIEDELKLILKNTYNALYVMSITVDGMREFVFYVPKWIPEEIEKTVKEIEKKAGSHELQFMLKEDSDWKTYTHFKG